MMSAHRLIRIQTGSRLHFGLIDTAPPFGGLGVMIDQHTTVIEVSAAATFCVRPETVDPRHVERAAGIAQRIASLTGNADRPPVAIDICSHASPHCGFGSGTQLAMAIAEGLRQWTQASCSNEQLAIQIAQRGKRSAIGVHGFFHGGLIYESGTPGSDAATSQLNPMVERLELPRDWRVVTIHPRSQSQSVHGQREIEAFSQLKSCDPVRRETLRQQITNDILPAAREARFESFAEAIENYNRASGLLFAAAQGGAYNGEFVNQTIARLKSFGALGVGQSSWGPGVFAWCPNNESAQQIADQIARPELEVQIAQPLRCGFNT